MSDRVPAPENQDQADPPSIFDQDSFQIAEQMLEGTRDLPKRPEDFRGYRFISDQPVGEGNMGEVWLAEDTAASRLVAIKFIRHPSDPDAWATRETRRLGALEHPYIARLYNRSLPEDETRWLAMEYVDGAALDEHCKEHKCAVLEFLALFRRICEAVQYAHSRQILHGDLKPSNIRVKANGEPKLLDFGLAQQFEDPETKITQSPTALGYTPAYAAPEQLRGEPIGVSVDVYALGVILYEVLTGTLPFEVSGRTTAEMKSVNVGDLRPMPPSKNMRPERRRQLPRGNWSDLDAICLKALAGTPAERYASVEALIRDLDHFSRSEPIDARRPHSPAYWIRKFVHRYRRAVTAGTAAVLVVVGLTGFFLLRLTEERNRALAESARTQRVKQFFFDIFRDATEDALPAEKSRFAAIFLDRGVRDAESLSQDPAMQADLYEGFCEMYQYWGNLERAEQIARRAVGTARSSSPNDRTRIAKAQLALGNVLDERGQYGEEIAIANDILKAPVNRGNAPGAYTLLANAYIHLGNLPRADTYNRQALGADEALHGWNSAQVADDLMNLGVIETNRGKYKDSEREYRKAWTINEFLFGKQSAQAADSASYVAQSLYFQGGREKEEAVILDSALATLERTRGEADSRVAFTLAQRGALAIELNDLDGAEKDFLHAAAIYRAARGDEHQAVATELANVASVHLAKKQFVLAEQGFRDVIRRYIKASLPSDNYNIAISRIKLGRSLMGQKRYSEAVGELLGGYEILKQQQDPSVAWLVKARHDLAEAYDALGKTEKARSFRVEAASYGESP